MDKQTWLWIGGGALALVLLYYFMSGSSSSTSGGASYSGSISGANATALAQSGLQYNLGQQELSNQLALGQLSYKLGSKQINAQSALGSQQIAANESISSQYLGTIIPLANIGLQNQLAKYNAMKAIVADQGSTAIALQPSPFLQAGLISSFGCQFGNCSSSGYGTSTQGTGATQSLFGFLGSLFGV